MRPVSDRFLDAVRGSHQAAFSARVVAPGQTGVNPTGTDILINGGDVRLDGDAADGVRSTLDLTTPGKGMWPGRATDLLAPYGNEVFVRRGIQYAIGQTEWVSLGYHRIDDIDQPDAPDGPIQIAGRDRMAGIVDGRLDRVRSFPPLTTRGAMLATLVTEIYPWATIEWDDPFVRDAAIGRQIITENDDRYKVCDELVKSVGKIWWWDHRGVLVVRTPPAATAPSWEVNHGQGGVLVSMARRLTREGAYNAVVATGEGADTATPVRAMAVDASPQSPTFWNGPFGKVPRFYSSPFITTYNQAWDAASNMLAKSLGLPYSVDFTAVPNAALEPYDTVRVRYPGRSELHVVRQLTVPLTVQAGMPASTREQTRILIGGA
ncbi:DUF5047 domain-containing protein [Micromonospora krabiensis]|uniref:DUF5047 domain-containing protein n=1 Tax=Micromonospora krabiensis TaxID=307121 RepID=A0A1C3N4S4_9ACTN|nr:DUF5047 domain-containing protein [Micromonospora krabiensis]SBV27577.1 protein of unknown function [Micromonospora krabiensis]